MTDRDINWFKKEIEPILKNYEVKYRFFPEGDFGSLNQVEIVNKDIGANVDFWGLGWIGIFIWSYNEDKELLNVLLAPDEKEEIAKAVERFLIILARH